MCTSQKKKKKKKRSDRQTLLDELVIWKKGCYFLRKKKWTLIDQSASYRNAILQTGLLELKDPTDFIT